MSINVLIVEDEMLVAEDLSEYLQESGFKVCGIAISAEECFHLIDEAKPDVVILDIQLKGAMNGIRIAGILAKSKIPFIFLTANTDDATVKKAIEKEPGAFISKPFSKRDVKIALELLRQKYNLQATEGREKTLQDFLFVREGNAYRRIQLSEILYVEAKGSYSHIVCSDKTYTLSYNLNHFAQCVSNPMFRKVHRSFIVNVRRVDGFDNSTIRIQKTVIPVSKQFHKEVMEWFVRL